MGTFRGGRSIPALALRPRVADELGRAFKGLDVLFGAERAYEKRLAPKLYVRDMRSVPLVLLLLPLLLLLLLLLLLPSLPLLPPLTTSGGGGMRGGASSAKSSKIGAGVETGRGGGRGRFGDAGFGCCCCCCLSAVGA